MDPCIPRNQANQRIFYYLNHLSIYISTGFLSVEAMAGTHDTGPRGQRYAFGLQGKALRANISIAGALGFLLFGYDQGFLSVRLI